MIVRKKRKSDNFTVLENSTINAQLSWAGRGLLVYLLSKPENWQISVNQLMKVTEGTAKKTGRDGLYSLLDELIGLGFIERGERLRNNGGQLAGYSYTVYESPSTAQPYTVQPDTANPHLIKNIDKKRIYDNKLLPAAKKKFCPAEYVRELENNLINVNAWVEWCDYRKSKKKPVSKQAADKQLKTLAAHSDIEQQMIVDQSIANDYTGLFSVKGGKPVKQSFLHDDLNREF